MLFDTHCHLDVETFDTDRESVFERARTVLVTRFLNPAYDIASSHRAVVMADASPEVVAAIGIHPNDIGELNTTTIAELHTLAQSPKVVAIGEIGLDFYWNKFSKHEQSVAFIKQLELAAQLGLPTIIHCRDAYDDTLNILEQHASKVKVLLHSFAGSPSHADRALALGYYLAIGGPVTYKNATLLRTIVSDMPLERMVLETDSPYLAPHPHRGKRNEPAYLHLTATRVAEIRGLSIEDLANITTANACTLFGLT
jgi:TatD DNase family protein